jgi:acetyl esterase/lipase
VLIGAPANASTPQRGPLIAAIAAPDQSAAIALGPPGAAAGPGEQWEVFHGERTVRNVTQPTLTPVLPEPGRATGAAVIVVPGGGFLNLSIDNEGFTEARWLAAHGVAAFVLKYRTQPTPRDVDGFLGAYRALMAKAAAEPLSLSMTPPEALADAQAAVRLVRARAGAWRIDPSRIGMLGFSAGAFTTLGVALADDKTAHLDFIAPIYGPMAAVTVPADAPPMFAAVALDDPLMARGKSLGLIESWRSAGRPLEVHLYARGGHGFGMTPHSAATMLWIDELYAWMKDQGLLRRVAR